MASDKVLSARKQMRGKSDDLSPQEKFQLTFKELNSSFVEREEEIKLALIAILCKQHLLLIGGVGVAKSMMVNSIGEWMDSKPFTVHCCKDTARNGVFGPLKISALKQDIYDRNLKGGAADCHFLILEETFKAGPAVLDTFIPLINERVYIEGLVRHQTPLWSAFGTSNEWSPEGCEAALSAFFDRFLIRAKVEAIKTRAGFERLVKLPVLGSNSDRSHEPKLSTKLSIEELKIAHKHAMGLDFSQRTADAFYSIHEDVKGIASVGDRRWKWSVSVAQAAAYLDGANEVQPKHLEPLKHVLWISPDEQAEKVGRIVCRYSNPIKYRVTGLLEQAGSVVEKGILGSTEVAKTLEDIRNQLYTLGEEDPLVESALEDVKSLMDKNASAAYLGVKR